MNNKKIFNITILLLWMVLIFVMSSFNADSSNSQSGFIVNLLSRFVNINSVNTISFLVRKTAHFMEYFILGVLTLNCFKDFYIKFIVLIFLSKEKMKRNYINLLEDVNTI